MFGSVKSGVAFLQTGAACMSLALGHDKLEQNAFFGITAAVLVYLTAFNAIKDINGRRNGQIRRNGCPFEDFPHLSGHLFAFLAVLFFTFITTHYHAPSAGPAEPSPSPSPTGPSALRLG